RCRDQRVEDLRPSLLLSSLRDDDGELVRHAVIHWDRGQPFDLGEGSHPLGADPGLGGDEDPDPKLSNRDDRDPSLSGEVGERASLLARHEHGGVEYPDQSSSIVSPATASTSPARPSSSGASRTIRSTSAGERCSFFEETGTSSATGRPRTVT